MDRRMFIAGGSGRCRTGPMGPGAHLVAMALGICSLLPGITSAADPEIVTIGVLSPTASPGLFCFSSKASAGTQSRTSQVIPPTRAKPIAPTENEKQADVTKTDPSRTFFNPFEVAKEIEKIFGRPAVTTRSPTCESPKLGTFEFRVVELGTRLGRETRVSSAGGPDLPAGAADLVRQHVNMIVAAGTEATLAARRHTQTIPIVMTGVSDPVSLGIVDSLRRPGGNVTGVSFLAPEVAEKGLEFLVELSPGPSHVGVLWNSRNPGGAAVWQALNGKAGALGVRMLSLDCQGDSEVSARLELARMAGINALLVLPDPMFYRARSEIFEWTTRVGVPSGFQAEEYADAGGLMSYGPREGHIYDLTDGYVRRIMAGAKPGDLPIQQPSRFHLVINVKTAKALGLRIPPSLLQRADRVIE
jgi:putative ABC transport system substrate-binding protein